MEDSVYVLESSDDDERDTARLFGSSSSAGASAVSGGSAGRAKTTKKPKSKKRAPAGGAAQSQQAKKRSKATKGRVSATWTDSEDENEGKGDVDGLSHAQPSIPWATWVKKPPPTMTFSGNIAQEPPAYWALKKGGSEAANLLDSMGAFNFVWFVFLNLLEGSVKE